MGDPTELFDILFLNTSIYGYIGIASLVTLAIIITKKEKDAGYFWLIVLGIMAVEYFNQLTATGYFALHIVFCVFGVLMCVMEMMR